MNKNNNNYTLKTFAKGKMVQRIATHKIRRMAVALSELSFRKGIEKAYIRVNYGTRVDNYGNTEYFWNDGEYTTKKSLMQAWRAFIGEGR